MSTSVIYRGATVQFFTTFYDAAGQEVQPTGATLRITYPVASDVANVGIAMNAPSGSEVRWTAQWDSRPAVAGTVFYSIHTDGAVPFSVEDGNFMLSSNLANQQNF